MFLFDKVVSAELFSVLIFVLKFLLNLFKINIKKINKIINILEPILIVFILIIITSYAVDNSYNPFLYFRF